MITRIHVNQHVIKSNRVSGAREPVLTVKTYKGNTLGQRADIKDALGHVVASVVYSPDKPLDCGAHVWIETAEEVTVS